MNTERIDAMVQRIENIASAREPVEAIFAALKTFEEKTRRHNRRHLVAPAPSHAEWTDIYAEIEPHAADLAEVLAEYRDSFSLNLAIVLDGSAGLVDEAAPYGIDPQSLLKRFNVEEALDKIDRVPSKLNVFLYSWGRSSLEAYQGEQMKRALHLASHIEREATYFASYLGRLLHKRAVRRDGEGKSMT